MHFSGVAIGMDKFIGVQYEGTMFVKCCSGNKWIGAVFSFQVFITNKIPASHKIIYSIKCTQNIAGYFQLLLVDEFQGWK